MLKKVVVFDNQSSGVGDMIEDELPVEVVRITDAKNTSYAEKNESEIRELTLNALEPYLDKADLIVLAEPEVALAAEEFLRRKFPRQQFVGYGWELPKLLKRAKNVRVLTTPAVRRMARYQAMKAECPGVRFSERECLGWETSLSSPGALDRAVEDELIEHAKEGFSGGIVVIYTTSMIHLENRLRQAFRWRATVVDMRAILLRAACAALGFRGMDGHRSRELWNLLISPNSSKIGVLDENLRKNC